MHLLNCLLNIGGDKRNSVPLVHVTPAEIAVLRVMHGDEAVEDIELVAETTRSSRAELARLRLKYGRREAGGAHEAKAVDALFPGAAARVYDTIQELDLPDIFYKAIARSVTPSRTAREVEPEEVITPLAPTAISRVAPPVEPPATIEPPASPAPVEPPAPAPAKKGARGKAVEAPAPAPAPAADLADDDFAPMPDADANLFED